MENVELSHLTIIHQAVQKARFELDDIATQEREDLDSLPPFTRSRCIEPENRLNAIEDTVQMLIQVEEMLESALSHRHSSQDVLIQTNLQAKLMQDTTSSPRSLSGLLDDILSSPFPFDQLP